MTAYGNTLTMKLTPKNADDVDKPAYHDNSNKNEIFVTRQFKIWHNIAIQVHNYNCYRMLTLFQ